MHFVPAVAGRASDVDGALGSGPGGVCAWHKGVYTTVNIMQRMSTNRRKFRFTIQRAARRASISPLQVGNVVMVLRAILRFATLAVAGAMLPARASPTAPVAAGFVDLPWHANSPTCRSARRWAPSRLGLKELCIVLGKCECGEQSMMCRLMRVAWSQPCPVHPGASNAEHQALVQRSWLLA